MSIDLEKAVEAFQLAELAYGECIAAAGVLFDPALGVEAGLIAALPYLRADEDLESDAVCRLVDSNWVAGCQSGWNFGIAEDRAGMNECINRRRLGISESKRAARSASSQDSAAS